MVLIVVFWCDTGTVQWFKNNDDTIPLVIQFVAYKLGVKAEWGTTSKHVRVLSKTFWDGIAMWKLLESEHTCAWLSYVRDGKRGRGPYDTLIESDSVETTLEKKKALSPVCER